MYICRKMEWDWPINKSIFASQYSLTPSVNIFSISSSLGKKLFGKPFIAMTVYLYEHFDLILRIPKATVQRRLQENNRNSGALWTFKQQLVYKVRVRYVKVTIANFGISFSNFLFEG